MSIEDDTFDVFGVLIVFQGSLVQSLLFTKLSDSVSVELIPLVHLENGISYLRSSHQVHFQHSSLPKSVLRSIVFHAVNEEGSHLLDSVELEEDFCNSMNIHVGIPLKYRFRDIESILRGLHDHTSNHGDVISRHSSLGL